MMLSNAGFSLIDINFVHEPQYCFFLQLNTNYFIATDYSKVDLVRNQLIQGIGLNCQTLPPRENYILNSSYLFINS